MSVEIGRFVRAAMLFVLFLLVLVGGLALGIRPVHAAPYAAMVIDARNGEVIHARNHDTKLHPASLTKMMTLYVVFEAIKHGEITLDTPVTISRKAASESCVCLGLRPGQTIALRYLIRAAAVRSANDAATALAEAISGSEAAFTDRMTRTARAMGMSNTTFRNAHGLTASGHLSTARDMTTLGRQLYFDYPQYFNLFSRRSADAGVTTVANTNRRFLDAYSGADGIKTGYTRAAGFNLTGSAQRNGVHIIATMFGGSSTAQRNARVAELLDIGFSRASRQVAVRAPATPPYQGRGAVAVAQAQTESTSGTARTVRLQTAVRTSPRPRARPVVAPEEDFLLAVQQSVAAATTRVAESVSNTTSGDLDSGDALSATDDAVALAALAPESLPMVPPAREEAMGPAEADPDAVIARDIEMAEAAGFSVISPEDIAMIEALEDDGAVDIAGQVVTEAGEGLTAELDASDQQLAAISTHGSLDPVSAETPNVDDVAADVMDGQEDGPPAGLADDMMQSPEGLQPLHLQAVPDSIEIALADAALPARSSDDPLLASRVAAVSPSGPVAGIIGANVDLDLTPATPAANAQIILTSADDGMATASAVQDHETAALPGTEIITRVSTSDAGRLWSVSFGAFPNRDAAERILIANSLAAAGSLGNGVRRVQQRSGGFHATVAGLTQTEASRACMRLSARRQNCEIAAP